MAAAYAQARCVLRRIVAPSPDACCAAQEDVEQMAEEAQYGIEGPHLIQTLEGSGIPAADLKKLLEAGFHTVEALAHAPVKQLVAIKGLSDVKVQKLKQAGTCGVPHRARAHGAALRQSRPVCVPSRGHRAARLHDRQPRAAAARAPDTRHHRLPRAGRPPGRCASARAQWATLQP